MTRQKSFKTRIRARMDKTGESYTAARRQLLDKSTAAGIPPAADTGSSQPGRTAGDAVKAMQHSGEAVLERTGRGWDEWFGLLDAWGATTHSHAEIARWLVQEHDVPGWWAQSITVTYEQARGLRVPGQRPDGYFSVSASKTVDVPVEQLFEAFADAEQRERWLPGARLEVRTVTAPKSFRAKWLDDDSRIAVGFYPKGAARSQAGLGHERLVDAESAAQMKAYWRERLAVLKALLES